MFSAFGRFLGSIGRLVAVIFYKMTGQTDRAQKALGADPDVMNAQYDAVLAEKRIQVNRFMEAVSTKVRVQEEKAAKLKEKKADAEKNRGRVAGALAAAKKRAAQLQATGAAPEAIKADAEFKKHEAAHRDFSSTLKEQEASIAELTADIERRETEIAGHERDLTTLQGDIAKLQEEKGDAVADVVMANSEKQANQITAGLAEDGTGETLQGLRERRRQAVAEAKVSRVAAGTSAKAREAEYDQYAQESESNSDFLNAVGLATPAVAAAPAEAKVSEGGATNGSGTSNGGPLAG
jgi:chromosome segregation ATPase